MTAVFRCPNCGHPRLRRRCRICELLNRDKETK